MNLYDEDKWDAAQLALDGRICIEFEALEASYAGHEVTDTLDQWRKSAEGQVTTLRAQIARVTHDARRAHWNAELERLGFHAKKAKAKAEPEPVLGVVEPAPVLGVETPPTGDTPSDG